MVFMTNIIIFINACQNGDGGKGDESDGDNDLIVEVEGEDEIIMDDDVGGVVWLTIGKRERGRKGGREREREREREGGEQRII